MIKGDGAVEGAVPVGGHRTAGLSAQSMRGGVLAITGQAIRFFMQIGALAVMARLLVPADYGLMAIAAAVVAFVVMLSNLGLPMAAVQTADLTQAKLSTLFWLNVTASLILMVFTMGAASALARFFGDTRLSSAIAVLSGTILLSALGAEHEALLRRRLRFRALAIIGVAATTAGAATGVVVAALDAGYWSLVAMMAMTVLTKTIGVWVACPWRPGAPVRGAGVRPLLKFGGFLVCADMLNYFARKGDDLIIGWMLGATPLGLYNRAYQLLGLPMNQLNEPASSVVVPALSRLQKHPVEYVRLYRGAMAVLLGLGMPIVAFLLLTTGDVVLVVFGPGWSGIVPVFRALGPASFVAAGNMVTGWVYLSLGNTKRLFQWVLVSVPLIVSAFAFGLQYGVVGVAACYSVVIFCLWFVSIWFCFRGTVLSMSDALVGTWRPLVGCGFGVCAVLALRAVVPCSTHPTARLVVEGMTFFAAYSVTWILIPGGWNSLVVCHRLVRSLRTREAQQVGRD